jgi:hypothetical protein
VRNRRDRFPGDAAPQAGDRQPAGPPPHLRRGEPCHARLVHRLAGHHDLLALWAWRLATARSKARSGFRVDCGDEASLNSEHPLAFEGVEGLVDVAGEADGVRGAVLRSVPPEDVELLVPQRPPAGSASGTPIPSSPATTSAAEVIQLLPDVGTSGWVMVHPAYARHPLGRRRVEVAGVARDLAARQPQPMTGHPSRPLVARYRKV